MNYKNKVFKFFKFVAMCTLRPINVFLRPVLQLNSFIYLYYPTELVVTLLPAFYKYVLQIIRRGRSVIGPTDQVRPLEVRNVTRLTIYIFFSFSPMVKDGEAASTEIREIMAKLQEDITTQSSLLLEPLKIFYTKWKSCSTNGQVRMLRADRVDG